MYDASLLALINADAESSLKKAIKMPIDQVAAGDIGVLRKYMQKGKILFIVMGRDEEGLFFLREHNGKEILTRKRNLTYRNKCLKGELYLEGFIGKSNETY